MSYYWVDIFIAFLYAFKGVVLVLSIAMLVLGLDDLFIDIVYWGRRLKRFLNIFRYRAHADEELLYQIAEKPLAIMVPAWQESQVIGDMARLLTQTLDYENYQLFIGTYPNDSETQAEVDKICSAYPNVHKVICVRPGPTSKADCLNNIVDAIQRFESAAGIRFAGFILHDAEDVVSPLELRLFNYLLPRKDLIQVPVYPLVPERRGFTGGHYLDEFAEYHSKDVVVREALIGQVPSAGVGTCFSHRAITTLLREGDGVAFDTWSLTEDYDIGYRLNEHGLACVFVRWSVKDDRLSPSREHRRGVTDYVAGVICVREHFPLTMKAIVRQKARWITGIVFQGTQRLGWSKRPAVNYFLWRDRRGVIAYPLALLVTVLFVLMLGLWVNALLIPSAWNFLSIMDGEWLRWLLLINGALFINRLFQRFFFVTVYYGFFQGVMSMPRMFWSNVINFLANMRALKIFWGQRRNKPLAWDKTEHEFPTVDHISRDPVGGRLVRMGAISSPALDHVLESPRERRLGRELLHRGLIDSYQLARALAEQAGVEWRKVNPFELEPGLVEDWPRRLALRYSALPLEVRDGTLIVGCESALSPVSLRAMGRQSGRKVSMCLVPQGTVTVGLRYWYFPPEEAADVHRLREIIRSSATPDTLLEGYCRHQVLLGELIDERGWIPPAIMTQALLDFEPTEQSLGDHLIARRLLTRERLEEMLTIQASEQRQARAILEETV